MTLATWRNDRGDHRQIRLNFRGVSHRTLGGAERLVQRGARACQGHRDGPEALDGEVEAEQQLPEEPGDHREVVPGAVLLNNLEQDCDG